MLKQITSITIRLKYDNTSNARLTSKINVYLYILLIRHILIKHIALLFFLYWFLAFLFHYKQILTYIYKHYWLFARNSTANRIKCTTYITNCTTSLKIRIYTTAPPHGWSFCTIMILETMSLILWKEPKNSIWDCACS